MIPILSLPLQQVIATGPNLSAVFTALKTVESHGRKYFLWMKILAVRISLWTRIIRRYFLRGYRRSSPLTSDFKVKTPVFILHGEEDRRVPISQSEGLYYYLKKSGVMVKFVRYPREPHGLREPHHQLDRYTRMLGWFNTHIK